MTERSYSAVVLDPEDISPELLRRCRTYQCRGRQVGCYLGQQCAHDGTTTMGRPHFSSNVDFEVHAYRLNYNDENELHSVVALGLCGHTALQLGDGERSQSDKEKTVIAATIDVIIAEGALINQLMQWKQHKLIRDCFAHARKGNFVLSMVAVSKAIAKRKLGQPNQDPRVNKDSVINALIDLLERLADRGSFKEAEVEVYTKMFEAIRRGYLLKGTGENTIIRFLNDHKIE